MSIPCAVADEPRNAPPSPAAQGTLPMMLEIDWSLGPNLPQGFQDSDGGVVGGTLVTVGGFCSGGLEKDNRIKPGTYPRGFLRKGWSLDLADLVDSTQGPTWQELPPLPGAARQGLSSTVIDGAVYFWGGFSYSEPFAYADGWRLRRVRGEWFWDALPDLPRRITTTALCTVGTTIYAFGGADYDATAFYTETDRGGGSPALGARLLALDTARLERGWSELPRCPGTPRWVHAMSAVARKLYVLGGATGNVERSGQSLGYLNVVDNWCYDVAKAKWSRIRDLPTSSANFPKSSNSVFGDRYVILPGGYQYGSYQRLDGSIEPKYGVATQANPSNGLYHDVFVYDTHRDLFGRATSLPIDNNLPMTVVSGRRIYLIGGETGGGTVDGEYFGHHPDLLLVGDISELDWDTSSGCLFGSLGGGSGRAGSF